MRGLFLSFLVLIFIAALISIRFFNPNLTHTENQRFFLPALAMLCFFVGCYVISLIVISGQSKYGGILYMLMIGTILLLTNIYILSPERLNNYIKGKKFSISGLFMALGVSSIIFGYLDNFGMKLGIDALDDSFLQLFLSPFSVDKRFKNHQTNIQKNLQIINKWTQEPWRKVVNQTLRHKDEIAKNKNLKDLSSAINKFKGTKLDIPKEILEDKKLTAEYVSNIKRKYDVIDDSKAMLGNTFSDFIGALLGAGIVNLFIFMTAYDGIDTGDDTIDESKYIKNLPYYLPVMEAVFISIGCLIPVFLNIAMTRNRSNKNNMYAWIIVAITAITIFAMMYISSKGVKDMTSNDKRKSMRKTLEKMKDRLDLDNIRTPEEKELLSVYETAMRRLSPNPIPVATIPLSPRPES